MSSKAVFNYDRIKELLGVMLVNTFDKIAMKFIKELIVIETSSSVAYNLGQALSQMIEELIKAVEEKQIEGIVKYDREAIELIREALKNEREDRILKIKVTGLDRGVVHSLYLVFSDSLDIKKIVAHYNGTVEYPYKEYNNEEILFATAIIDL